ncbi:hypothetical protein [Agromyces lapidis]|uniref:DUF3137 domain-containing protein n=1 Tax=Agromyces lapidis TaxID=279574 RepID=A0ABV5SLM0_9MICO|nr:hypothetical protein [Agromyces lapidis]
MSDIRQTTNPRFDPAPLLDPVDHAAVRDYEVRNGLRASGGGIRWYGVLFGLLLGGFAAVIVALPLLFVVMLVDGVLEASTGVGIPGDLVFPIAFAGAVTIIAGFGWYAVKSSRLEGEARFRVSRFAAANGFEFVPRIAEPEAPGMIFALGSDRAASEIVRLSHPRAVEIANYRYVQKTTKTHETFRWSYLAFALDRTLPHIVLDGVGNDSKLLGSNLPVALASAQRLSLEGDFDRSFALYCPEGYEADALYLFTPDVMARFVDAGADLDVEIVDDRLYVYASGGRSFSSADPAMWEWVFSTVDALNAKLARWERWRDERLAEQSADVAPTLGPIPSMPRGVAPQGRRLKQRIPLLAFLPIVVMVGIWFCIPLLESLA